MVHVPVKLCNLLHSQLLKHVELSTELNFKFFGVIRTATTIRQLKL